MSVIDVGIVCVRCIAEFVMWLNETVCVLFFFFLMIRRPPRSTQSRSSAASDVYKRQVFDQVIGSFRPE